MNINTHYTLSATELIKPKQHIIKKNITKHAPRTRLPAQNN